MTSYKMRKSTFLTIHIILPLLIGLIIYALFRNGDLKIYEWLEAIGYKASFDFNLLGSRLATHIPNWLKFSLSDGIWIYVFTSSIFLIWSHKVNTFWLITPLVIGIGLELSQLYKFIPGTFDYVDLLFLVSAYVLALTSGFRWRRKCIQTQFPY